MQGLRYAAVVEANRGVIAREAKALFKRDITDEPPIVQILAPRTWWKGWFDNTGSTRAAVGNWEPAFARLAGDIEEGRIGVPIECMALERYRDGISPMELTAGHLRWTCTRTLFRTSI